MSTGAWSERRCSEQLLDSIAGLRLEILGSLKLTLHLGDAADSLKRFASL